MNKFFIINGNNAKLVGDILEQRGNWQCQVVSNDMSLANTDAKFIWKGFNIRQSQHQDLQDNLTQNSHVTIVNHLQKNECLCQKDGLVKTLTEYYSQQKQAMTNKYSVFQTMATSFIVGANIIDDKQFFQFKNRFKELKNKNFTKEEVPSKHCQDNLWIVKPVGENQGRGIELFKNIKDITQFLQTKPFQSRWVIQKYIEKPLLYRGRKFDIRVWCLYDCNGDLYFYKQGYLRTSGSDYDTNSVNNFIHLTNNCLQVHNKETYGKIEDGNTLSFEFFQKYLDEIFPNLKLNVQEHFVSRMKDIMIDCFQAGKNHFGDQKNCFELFGFDFLIDEDFRTWLIEVNTNPYLGIPNQFIRELLPKMIDEMLELMVDKKFQLSVKNQRQDYGYEMIYSKNFSSRREFDVSLYPINGYEPIKDILTNSKQESSIKIQKQEKIEQLEQQTKIASYYGTLQRILDSYPYVDLDPFHRPVNNVINAIKNWSSLKDQDPEHLSQCLKLIQNTRILPILFTKFHYLETLVQFLEQSDTPIDLKKSIINLISNICRIDNFRYQIGKNQEILNFFFHQLLNMLDKQEFEDIYVDIFQSLMNLSQCFNRRLLIPGLRKENEDLRKNLISQGYLIVLVTYEISKQIPVKFKESYYQLTQYLTKDDLEQQMQILDQYKLNPQQTIDTTNSKDQYFILKKCSDVRGFQNIYDKISEIFERKISQIKKQEELNLIEIQKKQLQIEEQDNILKTKRQLAYERTQQRIKDQRVILKQYNEQQNKNQVPQIYDHQLVQSDQHKSNYKVKELSPLKISQLLSNELLNQNVQLLQKKLNNQISKKLRQQKDAKSLFSRLMKTDVNTPIESKRSRSQIQKQIQFLQKPNDIILPSIKVNQNIAKQKRDQKLSENQKFSIQIFKKIYKGEFGNASNKQIKSSHETK